MDASPREALCALLDTERVLTVAVVVEGEPVAALLPFAASPDHTALYVQASGLARHAKGLQDGATVGVVVHVPATPDRDAMQVPRLSVSATVRTLDRNSIAFADAAERLASRFPAMATTLTLGDFTLHALVLGRGRYIEGFARAINVGPDTFAGLGS